jgi:membrane protease YdiL (CAAX protease family)
MKEAQNNELEPMSFWHSLVLFGIPGAIVYVNIYYIVPYLVSMGVPPVVCFPPLLMLPVLIPAALLLYRREGNAMSWVSVKKRFRLAPVQGRDWVWIAVVFICAQLADIGFGFIGLDKLGRWLATVPLFEPPPILPEFMDPRVEMTWPVSHMLGVPLRGNWWVLVWWLAWLIPSNLGEELLWRGHILPRQELALGRWAWLANGLLWTFVVHAVLKWQYIGMLPSMLLTPWLAQKLRNSWASLIVHLGGNLLIVVLLVPGIART